MTSSFLLLFVLLFACRVGFVRFTPKLVAGAMNEYILKRGFADRDRLNFSGEGFHHVRDKAVPGFLLDSHLVAQHRRAT